GRTTDPVDEVEAQHRHGRVRREGRSALQLNPPRERPPRSSDPAGVPLSTGQVSGAGNDEYLPTRPALPRPGTERGGIIRVGTLILVAIAVAALLVLAGIALWTVQQRRRSGEEYRSAHRLLSRLQLVSRQLPAGLDEVALAQQTLEQLSR